jgi:diketogulonate reductase-like aldo/keto reductase
MRKRFGWTGIEVPNVGQGTWKMARNRDAVATLRRGIDLGLTHIDAAELYENEEMVGDAIAPYPRDRLFVVSKVLPSHASHKGTVKACEESLRRLRLDTLDCYLLHWAGKYPIEETMAGMADLLRAGKIRSAGVSNLDVDELAAANAALQALGHRLACNQVLYHFHERTIEHDLMEYCARHDIAVVGYSPFGHGDFPSSNKVLLEVARRHNATPRQIALAFLSRGPLLFAIPKASRVQHVEENARALDLALNDDDVHALERAFPLGPAGPLSVL